MQDLGFWEDGYSLGRNPLSLGCGLTIWPSRSVLSMEEDVKTIWLSPPPVPGRRVGRGREPGPSPAGADGHAQQSAGRCGRCSCTLCTAQGQLALLWLTPDHFLGCWQPLPPTGPGSSAAHVPGGSPQAWRPLQPRALQSGGPRAGTGQGGHWALPRRRDLLQPSPLTSQSLMPPPDPSRRCETGQLCICLPGCRWGTACSGGRCLQTSPSVIHFSLAFFLGTGD